MQNNQNSIETEEAVLGILISNPELMSDVSEILKASDFSIVNNSKLYSILLDLSSDLGTFDILLIENQLKKIGIYDDLGGRIKLTELIENAPLGVSIDYYIDILKTYSIQKKLSSACAEIQEQIKIPEKFGYKVLLDSAQKKIMDLDKDENSIGVVSIKEIASKQIQKLMLLSNNGETEEGIKTGFKEYDTITGGLNRSDLLILAARPAMGKTAFALNLATNVAKQGKSVLIFSLEMGYSQLFTRILANIANVPMNKLTKNLLTPFDLKNISDSIKQIKDNYNLFISEKAGVNILEIKNIARRFKTKHDLDFIIIDYLQLINTVSRHGSREQEVSEISRSLKNLARELDIPILALSQLSRGVESRTDKKPLLSDLRESGAIEQDADQVMFLFRAEYYKKLANNDNKENTENTENLNKNQDNNTPEIAELIIGKHRNGETGTINLEIDFKYQRFSNSNLKTYVKYD